MGATIEEVFANNPQMNVFGVVSGTSSYVQFPSGTAKLLRFKAHPDNETIFEIVEFGGKDDGRWPMSAGDDTGWIAPPTGDGNLRGIHNYKYRDTSGSSSNYLHWWIQK